MQKCKNPKCETIIDTKFGRMFCSKKCRNAYSRITDTAKRKEYDKMYNEIRHPKFEREIACACGCGRTFAVNNKGKGNGRRLYFDAVCCGRVTERRLKERRQNRSVTICRFCGKAVTGELTHAECRQARKVSFLKMLPCARCGKPFQQTQYSQIYDPECKIIRDKELKAKYKQDHKPVAVKQKLSVKKPVVKRVQKPVARSYTPTGSGVKPVVMKPESQRKEQAKMDEVIIMAWRKADAHERRIIELHPLNKHLKFGE